jgi:hypothetical protein
MKIQGTIQTFMQQISPEKIKDELTRSQRSGGHIGFLIRLKVTIPCYKRLWSGLSVLRGVFIINFSGDWCIDDLLRCMSWLPFTYLFSIEFLSYVISFSFIWRSLFPYPYYLMVMVTYMCRPSTLNFIHIATTPRSKIVKGIRNII